jgi:tetraacyldisaccharide 4'-kinase
VADLSFYFKELVSGGRRRKSDRLLLAFLRLASHPYAALLSVRAAAYRFGVLRSYRLARPVISVGNIVLGGTGKTPLVARLAADLMARGLSVAVLSRGYGGSARGAVGIVSDGERLLMTPEQAGDEPCLLAKKLPGLLVVIGADRYRAGLLALEKLRPDVFILDDGFQHLRLKRDLNLLILDGAKPFADGFTLPGGFLREKPSAAERCDLVVYTRSPGKEQRSHVLPQKPSCWTRHGLTGLTPLGGNGTVDFQQIAGGRVLAFAGIGDPDSFFAALERSGVQPVATISFPDHTPYDAAEIAAILRLKVASRADFLVMTEKDAVKLAPHALRLGESFATVLELDFEDPAPLQQALGQVLVGLGTKPR